MRLACVYNAIRRVCPQDVTWRTHGQALNRNREVPCRLLAFSAAKANHITVTPLHVAKITCGSLAVAVNLFCIAIVFRRGKKLERHSDEGSLWRSSKIVLACFATGLLCAAGAATLGFRFALEKL